MRERTAKYLVDLAEATRDLGGDLMVFGSPKQRSLLTGVEWQQAFDYATETFRRAMPGIDANGVSLCMEPLGPSETDFINTADEGGAVDGSRRTSAVRAPPRREGDVERADADPGHHPAATYPRTGHFHANDPNRRGPGFGDVDFVPIFRALKDSGYDRWVSVEVFDYTPDPETIASRSIEYMRDCEGRHSSQLSGSANSRRIAAAEALVTERRVFTGGAGSQEICRNGARKPPDSQSKRRKPRTAS